MVYICAKCGEDLDTHNDIAIYCDAGGHWFCYGCMDMSQKLFEAIISEGNTPMLFISCTECRASSFPVASLKQSTSKEFKQVNDRLEELRNKLDSYKNIETKIEQSVKLIKEQSKVSSINYADMVKKSLESKDEIIKVQQALHESVKDHTEQEERV